MKISKLSSFGKEIILLCQEMGVTPIIYGSYLYKYYTKDKGTIPHDIDFYVPKGFNEKMIIILNERKIKYKHLEEWHCLMIHKGGVKVDLDEIEYLYHGPKRFKNFEFEGIPIKALSLEGLMSIYKESIKKSDEPDKYRAKYEALKKVKDSQK